MSASAITPARHAERLQHAQAAVAQAGVGGLLIGPGPDLRWLIGYDAVALERLTMLALPARGRATLVVPRLEVSAAGAAAGVGADLVDLVSWHETEDPIALVVAALAAGGGPAAGTAGPSEILIADQLWALFVLRLQAGLPGARFGLASRVLSPLRQVKDAEEIELLRLAAHAADRTIAGLAAGRLVGRSELDVVREVRERLVAEGHDIAEGGIVASGPNSASPHHDPSGRVLQAGEPLILDIGGTLGGYFSDITRTLWLTGGDPAMGPDDAFLKLYSTLQAAQAASRAAVAPGVPCEQIDSSARDPIDAAGYGEHFFHRVGHGIGLQVHEDPYMVSGNAQPLAAGNAFSVEPGIYLEGRYGARIEDILVCGPSGPDELNQAPRELLVVSGV